MKKYHSIYYKSSLPCVVALGCFDGVHIGHKALILEAVAQARQKGILAAVWSFSEPPKNYFGGTSSLLTTETEKGELMRELGVDIFVSVPFEKKIFSLSPEDFFEKILIERMQACHVVCGFNYRFGKEGRGDAACLRKLCEEKGIGISVIPAVSVDGIDASSSTIREALSEGNMAVAGALLGRPYSHIAKIIDGRHLGRTLGFPTVNQAVDAKKAMPKYGVYLCGVFFGGKKRFGIANVGVKPTVDGNEPLCETHIFDFQGDLYGKSVKIEFLEFIRPEKKFASVADLKAQVLADINAARTKIKNIE